MATAKSAWVMEALWDGCGCVGTNSTVGQRILQGDGRCRAGKG